MEFLAEVRWSPYIVGAGIGILSWISILIAKKPLACSTSFARMGGLIEKVFDKRADDKAYYKEIGIRWGWQEMLVIGIVIGSFISALLSGDFKFQWVPDLWSASFTSGAVVRVLVALLGGIFIGFGSRWAGGCTSGHGISGTMQLSVSSWISSVFFFIGGIIAAHFIFVILA